MTEDASSRRRERDITTRAPGEITEERGEGPRSAFLVTIVGEEVGRRFELGDEVVIGREPNCEVWLPAGDVSRQHARIKRLTEDEYLLLDAGSRNGTRVNGRRVERALLQSGDAVGIGTSSVLVFTFEDPLYEKLLQVQKMEALGRLASGVAHDFNNLLAVVTNNAELLLATPQVSRELLVECLEEMRQASRRGSELTSQLLDFAGKGHPESAAANLTELVREACALARRTFTRGIELTLKLDEDVQVTGSRAHLYQVLMNLLINARDALPEGGEIRVSVSRTELEQDDLPAIRGGHYGTLEISDTGVGMDAETAERALEPFFTTRGGRKGTGLGLSIVRGIVKRHGGHIEIASQEGEGSTFRVYLPLAATSASPAETVEAIETAGVRACVLLVEDDALVRRSTQRLLRSFGCVVVTAVDGVDALEVYESNRERIDVVLLDMRMPRRDGMETFMLLRELSPGLPVVLLSGYADEPDVQTLLDEGAAAALRKPVEAAALNEALHDALLGPQAVQAHPQ